MRPIRQESDNDCFSAAIASLLEIPLSEVPNFHRDYPKPEVAAREWLCEVHGLSLLTTHSNGARAANGTLCIAVGESPRDASQNHAVVARVTNTGIEVAHDPHRDQTGIVGSPTSLHFLVRLLDIDREGKTG